MFNLYRDGHRIHSGVGFNHATGWLYRSQTEPTVGVFAIQAALRTLSNASPKLELNGHTVWLASFEADLARYGCD